MNPTPARRGQTPAAKTTYEDYLRSRHWRTFRRRYKAHRPWRCAICSETRNLQLHHVTYERLGAEDFDDVRPLCQSCHTLMHQLANEGQASLNPDFVFFAGRADVYARARPDVVAEQPVRLSEMTPDERKAYNKRVRSGDVRPRDWRDERRLPRRSS